ncbi:two-component system sensor histidine kinase DesK [Luteimonas cucumeris]|uniref:Two-component system sensor histidine kinase DesK n=1 Tax=Luteimonas cucumeris TaxID=985012 RepID=A0A562L2G8_9GAMM|nr:sensor histidine kinase [Luteimonas cucumeris]TWI01818.1 two-component system sensor histidine kinase DesK [Luteimonas cucumeris]
MKSRLVPTWLAVAPDSAAAHALQQGKSPWTDSVHLLWSFWVFITPIFGGGYSWKWLGLTLLSYPLFVLLYAMTLLAPRRIAWRYALGMVALSMLLLPVYPAGITYFMFGCIMLSACRSHFSLSYLWHLLLLNIAYGALAWWIGYPWQMLVWIPAMTFIVGIIVSVERVNQQKDAALKLSHDEVRRLAATAERERIGRDLHDLLGHTLSLITLKLELSRKLFDRDGAAARRELEEAERVARHALAEVRSAVTGIRATDLAAELAAARLLLESSQVRLDYDLPPTDLSLEVERGLSLVLREAVTNVARHARASRVQVAFARAGDAVQLRIVDNGSGGIAGDGNGLSGMRERMSALGGTLAIESPKGQGTRLLASVPAKPARGRIGTEPVQDGPAVPSGAAQWRAV